MRRSGTSPYTTKYYCLTVNIKSRYFHLQKCFYNYDLWNTLNNTEFELDEQSFRQPFLWYPTTYFSFNLGFLGCPIVVLSERRTNVSAPGRIGNVGKNVRKRRIFGCSTYHCGRSVWRKSSTFGRGCAWQIFKPSRRVVVAADIAN